MRKAVGGIILAAGRSSRMRQPKLLLPFAGAESVLSVVIRHAREAEIAPLLVVSGAARGAVEALAAAQGVRAVYNPDYAQGQSTSMKRGLAALPPDTAALFILGDQPHIPPALLRRIVEAYQQHDAPLVMPRAKDGTCGNPVLFAPLLFAELMRVEGDTGGRPVLRAHADDIHYVDVDSAAVFADIDTPQQYESMRDAFRNGEYL